MDAISVVLGVLIAAYEAFDRAWRALAADVGGPGALVAQVLALIALSKADAVKRHAEDLDSKLKELAERKEELEQELADLEAKVEDIEG